MRTELWKMLEALDHKFNLLIFVLLIVLQCTSGIFCYNLQRVEVESEPSVNLEINFYQSYEGKRFLEAVRKIENFDEKNLPQWKSSGTTAEPTKDESTPLDSWSVVWYIASFGGLIAFFLIVSCSEWCCRRTVRNNMNCGRNNNPPSTPTLTDTPPPSYDEFAPPSYESICLGRNERGSEKSEYDIYVVPVHALGTMMEATTERTEDSPPSYLSASFSPAYPQNLHAQQNSSYEHSVT